MKKLLLFFASCFLIHTATNAATTNNRHNEDPFVFLENGIEYAVYKEGGFDFNTIPQTNRIHINTSRVHINFNSGYNTSPFVQKNRYGDIVRIENTPICYTYDGKVSRIGNINIRYNRYGYVSSIGHLNINYTNHYNNYSCSGYINTRNHYYKPRYKVYKKSRGRDYYTYRQPKRVYVNENNYYNSPHNNKYKQQKKQYNLDTGNRIQKRNKDRYKPTKIFRKTTTRTKSYTYNNKPNNNRRRR